MKTLLLSTAAALVAASSLAQNLPQPVPRAAGPAADFGGGGGLEDEAARFDLKFPGGKVKEFVAAVSEALGKPVNVIIPKEGEGTMIPAVEVSRVTVPALFNALSNVSQHQVAVPTNVMTSSPGVLKTSIAYKTIGFTFRTEEKNSPDGVWTFLVTNPPEIEMVEPAAPPRTVQYFPVAEYLSHFSVEDITAAIESGWKLQGGPAETSPTIRFHEETKLLIIAGTEAQMAMIPQVLAGLSQMLRYPRAESFPITRKAGQIILPKLEFREATVGESVEFIRRKALEIDPENQGFNIVVNEPPGAPERKVTLTLRNVPALEALKLVAELSDMELEVRDYAIVLSARGKSAPQATTPEIPVPSSPQPPPATRVRPAPPAQPISR